MGIKGIRTALKVDLNKPASEQPGLHVSSYIRTLVIKGKLAKSPIEQMAPRRYANLPHNTLAFDRYINTDLPN
jgi:hypothetical protein